MRKFRLSLKEKAIIGIIATFTPTLITFALVYSQNSIYLKNRILDTLTVIAEAYKGRVDQFLEKTKARTRDFASDGFVRIKLQEILCGNTSAVGELNEHLVKNKLVLDKTMNIIDILSPEGRVVASTNSNKLGKDYSSETIFVKGKETVTMVDKCLEHCELTQIAVSAPILNKDTDRLIGVIVNYVSIAELDNIVNGKYAHDLGVVSGAKGKGAWKTLEIYVVNRDKRMITKSVFVKDAVCKQVVDTLPINEGLTSNKGVIGFYRDYRGVEIAGVSMYVPSMEWVLLVEINKSEVLSPVKHVLISAFITATVVMGMIALLFIGFMKKMVKPLLTLSDAAKDIARGNFDVCVPAQTHDEIGALCESFNYMTRHIKDKTMELEKSNTRLAEAQRIAHIGNWEWDVVKNEVSWSCEAYRIFGLTQETFVSPYETFLNHVYPDDREFVWKSMDDSLRNKKPLDVDHRILLKNATIRIVHERATVMSDNTGRVVRMMGTVQDITGRRRAEEAIVLLKTLTLSISESKDLHDALVVTLEKMCSATGWIYGEAWAPDQEGKCLVRDHVFYSKAEGLKIFSELSGAYTFPPGVGLPGRVWSMKKHAWVRDVTVDPNYPSAPIAKEVGLKAAAGFPVFSENEIVAVLIFYMPNVREEDEQLVSFVSSVVVQLGEVIKRKRAEAEKSQLSAIVESTTDLVGTIDANGRMLYMNAAGRKMLGIGVGESISDMNINSWYSQLASLVIKEEGVPTAVSEGVWIGESAFVDRNGREVPTSQVILTHKDSQGKIDYFSTIARDISERKRFEMQITTMASRDSLTNLLNRGSFYNELEGWLAQSRRFGIGGAVLFLDVDNFKYINDALGHPAGDKVLIYIAGLLRERLRETDILGRLGGDEFAVILPYTSMDVARSLAHEIRELVHHRSTGEEGRPLGITVSIGIAQFPEHGNTVETLITSADLAMYHTKRNGRNNVSLYAPEQKAQTESRRSWEKRIREALQTDGFVLYLQPILDIRSNCVVGHEVLLRLKGESGEIITPSDFFDAAEHFGLMPDIDYWVARRSMHIVKNLCKYNASTYLAVNLSGKTFADDKLLRLIKDELATTGIDPACIIFEITETTVIENLTIARHFIAELKSLGFRFALDDFGVGFSSFNYLKQLPVDHLKIDGIFVRNLLHDTVDQHLVKAMVEVACVLGKKTIAEYVESREILDLLRKYGVDYAQGCYVGEPCDVSRQFPSLTPASVFSQRPRKGKLGFVPQPNLPS